MTFDMTVYATCQNVFSNLMSQILESCIILEISMIEANKNIREPFLSDSFSPQFTDIPMIEKMKIFLREARDNFRQWRSSRLVRNQKVVSKEYDLGTWKKILDEKSWTTHRNLIDYILPNDGNELSALVGGRLVRISCTNYYKYRLNVLLNSLKHFAHDDELIELGCGHGMNLFRLSLAQHWKKLTGYDYSKNAVTAAEEASIHFGISQMKFGVLDLTNAEADGFQNIRGKTVFTHYCLEQLKRSMPNVIENILLARPRRVIHIEPMVHWYRCWSPQYLASYSYILKRDFQNNLWPTLKKLVAIGKIRILAKKPLGYSPKPVHSPMLICWEPV